MSTIRIDIPGEKLSAFCKRNHIRTLALFGSALGDEFTQDSDVDFLVEFDPEHIPGLFRLAGMELELTEIVSRKVDLRTKEDLSDYFRDEVISAAKVQYAEK